MDELCVKALFTAALRDFSDGGAPHPAFPAGVSSRPSSPVPQAGVEDPLARPEGGRGLQQRPQTLTVTESLGIGDIGARAPGVKGGNPLLCGAKVGGHGSTMPSQPLARIGPGTDQPSVPSRIRSHLAERGQRRCMTTGLP